MGPLLKISPVIFAISGLILFIIGQFLKNRNKLLFSLSGLILVGLFIYKLWVVQNESELGLSYADRGNSAFYFPIFSILFFAIGINILGFILWLYSILKITFENSIPKQTQTTFLLSGALIMIAAFIIYKVFGSLVIAVCFPIMTTGFFIGFRNYYNRLKGDQALKDNYTN